MMRRPAAVAVVLLAAAVRAAGLAAPDDLNAAMANKDWPGVLQITSRLLALKGKAAQDAGVDRVDVWTKRAEAQLQSSQFTPAAASFEKAAAEPGIAPEAADLALSTAMLCRTSDKRGFHVPASRAQPNPPTYDVLDPAKRKEALAALFAYDFDVLTTSVDRAKAATDGPAIAKLLKGVRQLRPLDRTVHDQSKSDASQTDGLEKTIAGNFAAAAEGWSTATDTKLDQIKAQADELVETQYRDRSGGVATNRRRRGTTTDQQMEVRRIIAEAQRLAEVYADVDKALTDPGRKVIEPIKAAVQGTYDKAKAIQNDSARGGTVNPNTGG